MLVMMETLHCVMTGMTQTTMPEVRRDGGDVCFGRWRWANRVEGSGAIASKYLGPSRKCLHRKTPRIKLDGNIIVSSEFADREKIFDNVGNNKDMI